MNNMKHIFRISFLLTLLIFSCKKDDIAPDAKAFLDEVLDIMESHSINKYKINWTEFRNSVFEKVGAAKTIEQSYIGVEEALILLNDHHSYFRKPDGGLLFGYTHSCSAESFTTPSVPTNIGYIKVNQFSGSSNSNEAIEFTQEIQSQISNSDISDIIGWIVDLRGNSGGNMYPMLAGIGPILGEGIAGYFVYPDNAISSWGYSNGGAFLNSSVLTHITNSYELINANPKVVVLLDNAVASSGEVIAISFIGRENTKSFGASTCGQSTANMGYKISNNSTLVLTVANIGDRNMNIYGTQIKPDVVVNNENIIEQAIGWLENK